MKPRLVALKLGGSLITNKQRPQTARPRVITNFAKQIAQTRRRWPELSLLIGNGAGSFGHYLALKHRVSPRRQLPAMAVSEIQHSVRQLNGLVTAALIKQGVPAVTVHPSSFISAAAGKPARPSISVLKEHLDSGRVPVVYGDIVPDSKNGGTILSTEALFGLLLPRLRTAFDITNIILLSDVDGVLDRQQQLIPLITKARFNKLRSVFYNPKGFDVTGSMQAKVESALRLTQFANQVSIANGYRKHAIRDVLDGQPIGTQITT